MTNASWYQERELRFVRCKSGPGHYRKLGRHIGSALFGQSVGMFEC